MGDEVDAARVGREHRGAHRAQLSRCLDALAAMLAEHDADPARSRFESGDPRVGMEVELVLVDAADPLAGPHRGGPGVLDRVDDDAFGSEIGAHTLELNVPPVTLAGGGLTALERALRTRLDAARDRAATAGARLVMTGVLPTLAEHHLDPPEGDWMTPSARYAALQDAVLAARGEDLVLDVAADPATPGGQHLHLALASLAAEAACTSTQLHLKCAPQDFAATWDAAQLLMGPQLALGANSPFALGRRLWEETRIPLFTQSVDVRTPELVAQGVRPRVFPGEGWADRTTPSGAAHALLAQNAAWFEPLLPQCTDEDPLAVLDAGGVPHLGELRLHGGTVWRWNRPVYDTTTASDGGDGSARTRAHLRVENRVLPAAPSVPDAVADAALWLGAVTALATRGPEVAALTDHADVVTGMLDAARTGLAAVLPWPGRAPTPAREMLLDVVIPLAAQGLADAGVELADAERHLGVAAARAESGLTGAQWQARTVAALQDRGASRPVALAGMLERYADHMDAGEPVHTWPLPR